MSCHSESMDTSESEGVVSFDTSSGQTNEHKPSEVCSTNNNSAVFPTREPQDLRDSRGQAEVTGHGGELMLELTMETKVKRNPRLVHQTLLFSCTLEHKIQFN